MIKVYWHAALVLLIPSSVKLVNVQVCWSRICKFLQPMGSIVLLPWPLGRKRVLIENTPNEMGK